MQRIGYIRTSTQEQCPDRQINGLKNACDCVFIESGTSACAETRPVYEEVIATLQPGDVLVVWDVDRAYRSVIDALTEVRGLAARGIGFEAMSRDYDLSTPEGGFFFTIDAALREWEREKLRKRTREGLAAARARGVKLGRPRKLTDEQVERACELIHMEGRTIAALAQAHNVTARTLSRRLKAILTV